MTTRGEHHGGKRLSEIHLKEPPKRPPPQVPIPEPEKKEKKNNIFRRSKPRKKQYLKTDFKFIKEIGKGAFSNVYLTMLKETQELFATKKISKELLVKNKQVKTVKMEKTVLGMLDHPNIIQLFCVFQDQYHLYFVLEYAPGGELFDKIANYGPLLPDAVKFYSAEIILGLEYMHSQNVIHRDMKPENIIFDKSMHLKITDFGTAKIKDYKGTGKDLEVLGKGRETFCGTAQYVSPEILSGQPCTPGSDLWALGCIIFQMITTRPPFQAESNYLIFQKIKDKEFQFPKNIDPSAKDLIEKLLVLESEKRLGVKSYKELKAHPFFKGIDWDSVNDQTPPLMVDPDLKKRVDEMKKKKKEEEEKKMSEMRRQAALDKIGTFKDLVKQNSTESSFKDFLNKGEEIIHAGELIKGKGLTKKKRTIIITTRPRIIYLDSQKGEIKGTIDFDQLDVELVNDKRFDIKIPGRVYTFEDPNLTPDEWVDHISKVKEIYKQLDRLGALK